MSVVPLTETVARPTRPRGRPLQLPIDSSPMRGMHVAATPRVAWLVATMRIYSDRAELRRRRDFATALNRVGIRADLPRISRWESGARQIPQQVLLGYGGLLGLRPGHLISVAQGIKRALAPEIPHERLLLRDVPESQDELDGLLERIDSGEHDGLDWTRLAAALQSDERIYLPSLLWKGLADKVVCELARSTGIGYVRRYETSRTLLCQRSSQTLMLKAVGAFVADPGAQVVAPVVTLLVEVDDAQVTDLVLRMLVGGEPRLRHVATRVLAHKIARGHIHEDELSRLEALLPRLLGGRSKQRFPHAAVDVLAAIAPDRQEHVLAHFHGDSRLPALRQLLEWGEQVAPDKSRKLGASIARRTQDRATEPGFLVEPDEMLARLVREALFHLHHERRHQASLLLGTSPYAGPLATVLVEAVDNTDELFTGRALSLLPYLAPPDMLRGALLNWALHHPSNSLRSLSLRALAHLRSSLNIEEQESVLHATLCASTASVRSAGLYLLGAIGSPLLASVLEGGDDLQRRTARWWLTVGPILDDEPPVASEPHQGSQPG